MVRVARGRQSSGHLLGSLPVAGCDGLEAAVEPVLRAGHPVPPPTNPGHCHQGQDHHYGPPPTTASPGCPTGTAGAGDIEADSGAGESEPRLMARGQKMTARDRAGDGRSPVRTAAGNQGFDFKSSTTGPLDGTLAVNGVVVTTA